MKPWLCLALLNLLPANPVPAASLPTAWKYVQSISLEQTGLVRLSIPLETLAAARPGLEDVRLYDAAGREVPFLIDRPAQTGKIVRSARSFQVTLGADATVATFETGLTQALAGITLETTVRSFLKAARLEGSNDGQSWQLIKQGEPLFQQPDGASQLHLACPPATWLWLRVILDDRRAAPIPLTGAQVHAADPKPVPSESLDLRMVEREEGPGQTRITLQTAGAHVTLAGIDFETPERLFTRPASLSYRRYADNEVREVILASGTLYRIALEGQPAASHLTLAAETSIPTRELILTLQNGDSPALPITAIRARRRPVYMSWLANQPGVYHLLSGNPACPAPRYDLTALPEKIVGSLVTLRSPATLNTNTDYRPGEPLPEIQEPGAAIDLAKWKFRKRVELSQGGVQQLELDMEVLSGASPALNDLRLARTGKQVPYLLERTPFSRSFAPVVEKADDPKRRTISRWTLRLPHASLPITHLSCETTSPFFKREASLGESVPDERGNLYWARRGTASWVRSLSDKPETLVIRVSSPITTDTLVLEMDNGDNPPLELGKVQAFYPATRLLFKAAREGDLFLYYGNPRAEFPRYDIDLVASQLLSADKTRATLGQVEPLQKSAWAGRQSLGGATAWIFWGVLAGVVVVLLLVISHLLPKKP